jgi:hypothetical protein
MRSVTHVTNRRKLRGAGTLIAGIAGNFKTIKTTKSFPIMHTLDRAIPVCASLIFFASAFLAQPHWLLVAVSIAIGGSIAVSAALVGLIGSRRAHL